MEYNFDYSIMYQAKDLYQKPFKLVQEGCKLVTWTSKQFFSLVHMLE